MLTAPVPGGCPSRALHSTVAAMVCAAGGREAPRLPGRAWHRAAPGERAALGCGGKGGTTQAETGGYSSPQLKLLFSLQVELRCPGSSFSSCSPQARLPQSRDGAVETEVRVVVYNGTFWK